MSGSNVVPLRPRKPRASDFIERATAEGKPLPLQVMLDMMWRLVDEAQRLESDCHPDDQIVARVTRDRLFRVAAEVAPYLHPRMASTVIAGDPDNPVKVTHEARFARLTDAQATRFLEAITTGEMTIEQVDAELAD